MFKNSKFHAEQRKRSSQQIAYRYICTAGVTMTSCCCCESHKSPGFFKFDTLLVCRSPASALCQVHVACRLSDFACANETVQLKLLVWKKTIFLAHDVLTFEWHFSTNLHLFHNSISFPFFSAKARQNTTRLRVSGTTS